MSHIPEISSGYRPSILEAVLPKRTVCGAGVIANCFNRQHTSKDTVETYSHGRDSRAKGSAQHERTASRSGQFAALASQRCGLPLVPSMFSTVTMIRSRSQSFSFSHGRTKKPALQSLVLSSEQPSTTVSRGTLTVSPKATNFAGLDVSYDGCWRGYFSVCVGAATSMMFWLPGSGSNKRWAP